MVHHLIDKQPDLNDYLETYLADSQIREQLFRVGREGYESKGRGVVVVDVRRFSERTVRFYYLSAGKGKEWEDAEMEQICHSYDPGCEVIVFLFFGEFSPNNECYKLADGC